MSLVAEKRKCIYVGSTAISLPLPTNRALPSTQAVHTARRHSDGASQCSQQLCSRRIYIFSFRRLMTSLSSPVTACQPMWSDCVFVLLHACAQPLTVLEPGSASEAVVQVAKWSLSTELLDAAGCAMARRKDPQASHPAKSNCERHVARPDLLTLVVAAVQNSWPHSKQRLVQATLYSV